MKQDVHTAPRTEAEYLSLMRRLEIALDASQIGVWEHDLTTGRVIWDEQMHRIYQTGQAKGVPSDDVIWSQTVHPEDREAAHREFESAIANKSRYASEFRIFLPDGSIRYIRSKGHYYEDPNGARGFIGVEWDVTSDVLLNQQLNLRKREAEARAVALEKSRAQVEYAAHHDYLTDLPNRRFFVERFNAVSRDTSIRSVAVLQLDLDNFKDINDTAGHGAGDVVLQRVALILQDAVDGKAFIARMGGDEFVLLITDFGLTSDLKRLAGKINARLQERFYYEGRPCRIEASIGVAFARGPNEDRQKLLAEADAALYRAKKLGRNRAIFFSRSVQRKLDQAHQFESEFRDGLQNGEFFPHYQLQVDAVTLDIAGVEALARWNHPRLGLLGPDKFMRVAHQLELVAVLDQLILKTALNDLRLWLSKDLDVPHLSVNVSASRLRNVSLFRQLEEMSIPPGRVSFELLETIFLDEFEDIMGSNLERLKALGIEIEIDDFGSGHASIVGLVRLRPKRLKIDRQLICPIDHSEERRQIVRSIIDIAKALSIEIIAEGVETAAHANILANLGCTALQGYGVAHPMSGSELPAFVREESWRKRLRP